MRQVFNSWKSHQPNRILSSFFCFYLLVCMFVYLFASAMVFDENWFFNPPPPYLYEHIHANYLGYGDLYWIFTRLFHNKLVLRFFSMISMLSVPVLLYAFGLKLKIEKNLRYPVMMLWLSFPAAWWVGKLIGPDLYCLFLSFFGLYLAYPEDEDVSRFKNLGFLLMGLAVGIKLNYIFMPIFCLVVFLQKDLKQLSFKSCFRLFLQKTIWLFVLFFLLGFLLSSCSLLWSPLEYFKNLSINENTGFNFTYEHIIGASVTPSWDLVTNPSLVGFSLSAVSWIVLAVLVIFRQIKIVNNLAIFSLALLSCFAIFLMAKTASYSSWSWFPLLALLSLSFYYLKVNKTVLWALVGLNFLISAPLIVADLYIKCQFVLLSYYKKSIHAYSDKLLKENHLEKIPENRILTPLDCQFITFNDQLKNGKLRFPRVYFFSKNMLSAQYANSTNSLVFLHDILFRNIVLDNFQKDLAARAVQYHFHYQYLGSYRNVYGFLLVKK